ncbi:hypothetical protein AAFF_G00080540 [Aldrovandia affinis]|uniref:Uncharacterized protein n=1 Tax=Aldrovandia affinis TaxID=143900 RepID=A0AAD7WY66_9TELE|nr:hypothetical protein AAFF_G00080540 [Aldrovandia affinis]
MRGSQKTDTRLGVARAEIRPYRRLGSGDRWRRAGYASGDLTLCPPHYLRWRTSATDETRSASQTVRTRYQRQQVRLNGYGHGHGPEAILEVDGSNLARPALSRTGSDENQRAGDVTGSDCGLPVRERLPVHRGNHFELELGGENYTPCTSAQEPHEPFRKVPANPRSCRMRS